jgi:uncharacterized protein HemX
MSTMSKKMMGAAFVALAMGLTAGCATTGQVEEAKTMASEAKQAAMDAQAAAARAQKSADQANACCQDTNAKLDRMFKKSMYK